MGKRIVVALGGNALGKTPSEQLELVKITSKHIIDLVEEGNDVIVTHGNGPQVGMINLAMETSHKVDNSPAMPFAECGAMSQGYIGYHLQQSLRAELQRRGLSRGCVTIVTEVEVDKNDPAFQNPTKPIGAFYTKEEADKLIEEGYTVKEDSGRGYRRVIASPVPLQILESSTISSLYQNGNIVIACGGGGIPVVKDEGTNGYRGIDAVIDKDRTSAKLASIIQADILLILTAVDKVALGFNTPNQRFIDKMTISEAENYIERGEFAKGSMLPKVEACLDFVKNSNGQAIITSLENAKEALATGAGTVIVKEGGQND